MTGDPTPYDDDDYMSLLHWLHNAFTHYSGSSGFMTITADIEWSGEYNPIAHRTTTLWKQGNRQLTLDPLRADVAAAIKALRAAERLFSFKPPAMPSTDKGKANWLGRTEAGRAALRNAGFNPSARTQRRWRAGGSIGKGYLAALRTAAANHHQAQVTAQSQRKSAGEAHARSLARQAGLTFTAEVEKDGYKKRFFSISDLYFHQ